MTFLILIIIILGWVVFEQYSAKKNKDVHAQEIKDIEDQRNEEFKKSSEFLNNTLKVNSIFKKLTTSNIKNVEIGYFFERGGSISRTEKEINIKYSGIPFYLEIYGDRTSTWCFIICKMNNISRNIIRVDFENIEDDKIIIEKIFKTIKKTIEQHKLKE